MHVREMIELGTTVATHCQCLVNWSDPLSERHVEQYWLAARCRQDRWGLALKNYRLDADTTDPQQAWGAVFPTIQEVFGTELLTRTWTAAAMARDRKQACQQWEPIARSVLLGHVETRNRAMNVMVYGRGFRIEEGVVLNRLRHRIERWTDMLLARIMSHTDVSELGFDAQRVRDFAQDMHEDGSEAPQSQLWQIICASIRAAFQHGLDNPSPNADLNHRIAGGILSSFPPYSFSSTGLLKADWMLRLEYTSGDMQGLIDELVSPPRPLPRRFFVRR